MSDRSSATVRKSLDNFDLVPIRARAGVRQKHIAAELGLNASEVSNFETGKRGLPRGMGRSEYLEALDRIIRRQAEQEAGAA